MMCNGEFLQKDLDEALEYLDNLAKKAHTWNGPIATESTNRSRPIENTTSIGIYHLREEDDLGAKVDALTKELKILHARDSKPIQNASHVEFLGPYFVCGRTDHPAQWHIPKIYSPFSETYNPGWLNHPNLSWKSEGHPNKTHIVPPYQPTYSRNSLEDTLHAFIKAQSKTNQKFETMIIQIVEENKEIKSHMFKLTNALAIGEWGKFPTQAQPNPREQHMAQTLGSGESNLREVNVITTQSGKVIEPIPKPKENEKVPSNSEESTPSEEVVKNPSRVPFPQALKSTSKSVGQHNEILEHLKQVKINLPLLHVISQVPIYAKVLKDLYTVKKKHHIKKTAFLTEHVSVVIGQKILPKYKDPGCLTVSCIIGNHEISQALLDLGANINIMPYDIYLSLGLGEIKPTSGVVEDMLVQVDKFYYPIDFLILNLKVDVNVNSKISIILGRPFLTTANALINYRNGQMKLSFRKMTLDVNIFCIMKQPEEDDECHQTFMIDALVQEKAPAIIDPNPLNSFCLNSKIVAGYDDVEYANICAAFDNLQDCETSPTIISTELGAMQRVLTTPLLDAG
ncbi:uncharacterized protein LOC111366937 [Olea europaea var. sylvestris]|uniref:uncharacterized protein LOC111366937 n=1 Tax=Olea europaea var. sylvestris TaxID=158386 RepID=UPI000C1D0C13|nr:uncharacterized protein LOC111366937 [Olea europaea var. sylvestris]